MNIVSPSIEIMHHGLEIEHVTPEQHIEKVGRTCYKSEDKITEDSAAKFVSGLIKRGHEAMIEHWNLIFQTTRGWYEDIIEDWDMLLHNGDIQIKDRLRPFLRFTDWQTDDGEYRCIVSGNMRAWRDYTRACIEGFGFMPQYMYGLIKCYPLFFPEFQEYVPVTINNYILKPIEVKDLVGDLEKSIHWDVTVKFTCDRGVSHEIVRHRTASFAQESTRYCNYSADKYGNCITVVEPSWCEYSDAVYSAWVEGCTAAEDAYFKLLNIYHCSPQEARSVLPSSTKTEVIMTGNMQCWEHFFKLRCAPDAHPDIQVVAKLAASEIKSICC